VGEWLKPAVLKTVRPQKGLVGSNPTPSAIQSATLKMIPGAPHGMCSTLKDQINEELLAFFKL
jgi:hypothetical protein